MKAGSKLRIRMIFSHFDALQFSGDKWSKWNPLLLFMVERTILSMFKFDSLNRQDVRIHLFNLHFYFWFTKIIDRNILEFEVRKFLRVRSFRNNSNWYEKSQFKSAFEWMNFRRRFGSKQVIQDYDEHFQRTNLSCYALFKINHSVAHKYETPTKA